MFDVLYMFVLCLGAVFGLLCLTCYVCLFCFGGSVFYFVVFDVLSVFVLLLWEVCLFCCYV